VALAKVSLWGLTLTGFLWAQLSFNPYSGYGWGYTYPQTASSQAGMGRLGTVGLGMSLPYQPAHSAHLRGTQVDFSAYSRQSTLKSAANRATVGTGSLQNLLLSFTNGKGWGLAMGLAPEAMSGYYSSYQVREPIRYAATDALQGTASQAYLQMAIRWKSLALGYHFGYLRGTYERTQTLQLATQSLPDYLLTTLRFKAFLHSLGLLYQDSTGSLWYQVGLSYRFQAPLSGGYLYSFQKNLSFTSVIADTFAFQEGRVGRYPAHYRAGVALGRKNWMGGVEGGYMEAPPPWQWSGFWPASGRPSWDLRLGIEWLPDPRAPAFYKRFRYQAGAYMQTFPYTAGRLYAATLGLGWAFPRSASVCYLSGEYGRLPAAGLTERYWQISIGLAFREQWFVPPRID
jgi:hypothetical protein